MLQQQSCNQGAAAGQAASRPALLWDICRVLLVLLVTLFIGATLKLTWGQRETRDLQERPPAALIQTQRRTFELVCFGVKTHLL